MISCVEIKVFHSPLDECPSSTPTPKVQYETNSRAIPTSVQLPDSVPSSAAQHSEADPMQMDSSIQTCRHERDIDGCPVAVHAEERNNTATPGSEASQVGEDVNHGIASRGCDCIGQTASVNSGRAQQR